MFKILIISSMALASSFLDDVAGVRSNYFLCEGSESRPVARFFKMADQLQMDEDAEIESSLEITEYTAFSFGLKDRTNGEACSIRLQDDCFRGSCSQN